MSGLREALGSLKELRVQWIIGSVIAFLLSLIMGVIEGGPYPYIYPSLWFIFGILFLFCMYKAFPNTWYLLIPVIAIYMFAFFGIVSFLWVRSTEDWGWILLGLLCEGIAFWAVLIILYTVANRRDEMMLVLKHKADRSDETDHYVPLGLWSVSIVLIFFLSNISIWYWSDRQINGSPGSLVGYIVSETLLLVLLIYFFRIPESRIDHSYKEDVVRDVDRNRVLRFLSKFSMTKGKRSLVKSSGEGSDFSEKRLKCPNCGRPLIMEERKCPECGRVKRFGWCSASEDFIVNCMKCRNLIRISGETCPNCGEDVSREIGCSCGNNIPIDRWSQIADRGDEKEEGS